MEMILLCRNIDAKRGYNVGLCNEVVPTGKQVEAALAMAREMTEFSPMVLKTLKRFVTETVLPKGPSEYSGRAQRSLVAVRENEDAVEAIAAVKEKRKPKYKSW
jgi:enoyl-CoA hydratase/carnithine racemase